MVRFYKACLVLRRLPWYYRILIIALLFTALEVPVDYFLSIGVDRSIASILFFPGILAAFFFLWKKAFAVQCSMLTAHVITVMSIKGYHYSSIPTIIAATCTNFFIIWTIGGLRRGWEQSEKAVEEQKRLATTKDQFIANINHELRSPLVAILGSLDILRDDRAGMDQDEHTFFLDHAIYAGDELLRLTDNILDAVRADAEVSPPISRNFYLDKVLADVLRHANPFGHPIHIDIPEGIAVIGDSQQVGQVVRNLLSNCFKYSPKESPISVRLWQDDSYAYVCIRDQGPGICSEQLPQLFQKFSRLERDIAGSVRGIGLGLYICRKLIENMDGRIWIESMGIKGEGSRFYFTLPLAPLYSMDTEKRRRVRI